MTNTRPPGRGPSQLPRHDSLGDQRRVPAERGYGYDPRGAPPPRRASPLPTILFYGGVLLLAFGVGAGTFFVMSPPADLIRREIIARVKAETGRELSIAGGASFTIFPSLGLRLGDITLSAPPNMGGEPLLKASSFDVGVRLWPLLRQEIVVDRVVLHAPVFSLRVDSEGRRSWDMAGVALPVRFAGADRSGGLGFFITAASAAPSEVAAVSLEDISITNGAVRYNDDRSGVWARFDGLNAEFSLAALDQPLEGSGSIVAEGETFTFKSRLTTPADLAAQRPAQFALTVTGAPLSFSYDGIVSETDGEGTLTASSPSLAAFSRWWGTDLSSQADTGAVAFSTRIKATGTNVELSSIDLKAGRMTASGTVAFEERPGARPHVGADLKISGLDVADLPLGADLRTGRGGGSNVQAPSPLSLDSDPAPQHDGGPGSIDDLLNRPGPKVKGYTQRAGWSTEPLDVRALALADVDARVALTDVSYGPTRIDGANVNVAVKDEVARLTVADLRLYDGNGRGLITLDASAGTPSFSSDVTLTGIAAGPLLRDAAQIDWITGNADVAWKVTGRGATEADLVASLGGTSRASLSDGAVVGFDLGGAMRELGDGSIPSLESDKSKKTDFRSLTGTFTIANGIASNSDLKLDSEHLEASGEGNVDLPQRTLDYTVRPKLLANLGGEGAENAAAIEIPVHLSGSWEDPQLAPDIGGALNSQNNLDAVKKLGKQLEGKGAGEIVKDLFGKSKDGGPSKAEKLLDGLFGGKE